jgi:hypothetical protein
VRWSGLENLQPGGYLSEGVLREGCFEKGNTRRIATVEGKVRDADQNLVVLATATFRIFERRGNPIV